MKLILLQIYKSLISQSCHHNSESIAADKLMQFCDIMQLQGHTCIIWFGHEEGQSEVSHWWVLVVCVCVCVCVSGYTRRWVSTGEHYQSVSSSSQALLSSEPKSSSCSLLKMTMRELMALAKPAAADRSSHISSVPQVGQDQESRAALRP